MSSADTSARSPPAACARVHQQRHRRLDPGPAAGDPLGAVPAGGEHLRQPPVGGLRLHPPGDEVAQPGPGVGVGRGRLDPGHDGVDLLLEQRVDQVGPVGEAPVDRAHAHPGGPGDLLEAGREAALGEHLPGRGEDQPAVALGVAAERPRAPRPRRVTEDMPRS